MRIIFIFRRDLRIHDNPALVQCLQACVEADAEFYPCFFFDRRQISPTQNQYFSVNAVTFMFECLRELDDDLYAAGLGHLHCFEINGNLHGSPHDNENKFFNKDITPYAITRDGTAHDDPNLGRGYLLSDSVHVIKNGTGKPYSIFTPFYRCAVRIRVPATMRLPTFKIKIVKDDHRLAHFHPPAGATKLISGGRKAALRILRRNFRQYAATRDVPTNDTGTTHLSAYLKFGVISVREAYHAINVREFRRQLYWREFYALIAFHFPHVLKGQTSNQNLAMHESYNRLRWSSNYGDKWIKWCQGRTGFPFVDAGMRQLNQTGYMHNRLRMVTATFLIKDLHIDWRLGEKYFAQNLTDYDPAQNNGGWQWCASTGADAQPYFRIFNPWEQSRRFDPDAIYIKRWLPELIPLTAREIHNWHTTHTTLRVAKNIQYPAPLCDHHTEAERTLRTYRSLMA